jgi:NOL1/NOP2/fmu family ribosome biogenesis protein
LISSESLLVSNEVIRARANTLCEILTKWGLPNVVVTQNDPEHFKKLNGFFDLIVVDAPCSGEGLFRKEPDAVAEWSPDNVALCSQRQRRILSDVFPSLKQNGVMIYCTCTFNTLENEGTLNWLASQHDIEFLPIPTERAWGIEEVQDGRIIGYRFYPHKTKGEGFFLSAFRKKAPEVDFKMKHKKDSPVTHKDLESRVNEWLQPSDLLIESVDNYIKLFPKKQFHTIELLTKELRVLMAGTTFGTVKHGKIIPDHALALSPLLNHNPIGKIEVSKADALRYLRKENFEIDNQKIGFALVTYLGVGLGWVNGLGNRFNNLYPTNWRIRMKRREMLQGALAQDTPTIC